jgi:putative ATP-binding cassette transporter
MKLILFLLRTSWRTALLAALVGALSGGASATLVALTNRTLHDPEASSTSVIAFFAGLCVVVLITHVVSQMLLTRLSVNSVSQLRLGLCQRILESPLRHLEEIGGHRMVATLTNDVGMISHAMGGLPSLAINVVILICGAIYLGSLSLNLMLGAAIFCMLGMATYWYSSRWAERYQQAARDSADDLFERIEELIRGVKELKTNRLRRRSFFDSVAESQRTVRDREFVGETLYDAAATWGRLMFFIAIGMLLFVWPRLSPADSKIMTAYVLTIFYLMSPLEQIMAWLPSMGWACTSVAAIERLGLMLDQQEAENLAVSPVGSWERIDLTGVTHNYRRSGQPRDFVLGPIDLTLYPGEIVFVIGGNGSGKTTLAKLLVGLYEPANGEIRLDDQPITADNRESYRQLFSAIFDGGVVFENLWGLESPDLDRRARGYLRELQLHHAVNVVDGVLSTTHVSRGQRKRLALLTAYLENRPIYLFDEWAADQDPTFRKVFYLQLLPELKRRGKTVVAITHDDRYFDSADRVIKLEEGKLVETFQNESLQEAHIKAT